MTLGEKIIKLRNAAEISQEQLAEKIGVSRQSVSKWEMDQALPQIDKVIQLCKLFEISADTLLLSDDAPVMKGIPENSSNKYFGTDGFRGEANRSLTSIQAFKVGRFLGWYFSSHLSDGKAEKGRPKIIIGKDTRRSSYTLEYAIAAGITASGADAYMLHVTTTPSVSYATRTDAFDCGIMITASHNPYYDNGIKVINRFGEKMDDKVTALIEAYLDGNMKALGISTPDIPLATGERIGCIVDYVAGRNRYVAYLIALASHSYKKLRIGLDCANGAAWTIARSVFNALGAQTYVIGDNPDGLNVNENCGSTHIENLCNLVREQHLDLGFAFDGDCDRCIAVDENGNIVDGDKIMFILAKRLKSRGMLKKDTLVTTVMSNSGLLSSLEKLGIKTEQTAVGDRFVYERMQSGDFSLGGEQSGHIILKKYATTGDGLLTAIMMTEEICDSKTSLSKLCEEVTLYPQYIKNIRVKNKEQAISAPAVLKEKESIEKQLCGKGRVLLRKSGTEPCIRIMVECEEETKCEEYSNRIAQKLLEGGHTLD